MKTIRPILLTLAAVAGYLLFESTVRSADIPPTIQGLSKPAAGQMQIIFHGGTGPFRIEMKGSLDPAATWADIPGAYVTQLQPGVFMGFVPIGLENLQFYRVVSESDGITELNGWTVLAKVSAPANGRYFVPGESPVVTVTILDTFAQGLKRESFSSLNLYLSGPQDPRRTVAAVKLLNASTNRAVNPHHYIDLKTNPQVQLQDNVITYRLRPVTDEAPGTYRLALWSVLASDRVQQIMKFADLQIGTDVVESPVVANHAADGTAKCAACHQGPISGKTYLHHIDPSLPNNPAGYWSLDFEPVKSCSACHNQDGYAAYRDTNAPGGRVPDPVMRRVHGVHMGAELKLPFNTDPTTGDFRNYTHVEFPPDVRNCTKCHLDDRWKTNPTRAVCTTCHDNVWFGREAPPAGMVIHAVPLDNDLNCSFCHPPTSGGFIWQNRDMAVAAAHQVPPPAINMIDLALSRPANGTYYVAGERPVASVVFRNDAGSSIGDHRLVNTTNFSTASLFVYGPRSRTLPVLTSIAKLGIETKRASVTCATNGPWPINGKSFKLAINGSQPQVITMVGTNPTLVTPAQVVATLNPILTNLNGGAIASLSGSRVVIRTLIRGASARIEIYDGEVSAAMGWRAKGVVIDPDVFVAAVSTPANDLRPITADPLDFNDPMVTRTETNILYQLDDVAGLQPGTYGIYAYYLPVAGKNAGITNVTGLGQILFQVGTATPEKKIATSCMDCHGDTIFHLSEGPVHAATFDTDYCKACHDYSHPNTGDMFKNQGGTSVNGWSGFGAMPISRRVHGVHRGRYLEHPEQIYANATVDTFGHIIFPQDIRNCTKCHAETDTWKEKPSRMACLACHDTDAAKVHGLLMTYIPDPADPYGPKAQESCEVCHGKGREFSPDKVHSISNPYVPPYPREPAE